MNDLMWIALIALAIVLVLAGEVTYLKTGSKGGILVYLCGVLGGGLVNWDRWGLWTGMAWWSILGALLALVVWGRRSRERSRHAGQPAD